MASATSRTPSKNKDSSLETLGSTPSSTNSSRLSTPETVYRVNKNGTPKINLLNVSRENIERICLYDELIAKAEQTNTNTLVLVLQKLIDILSKYKIFQFNLLYSKVLKGMKTDAQSIRETLINEPSSITNEFLSMNLEEVSKDLNFFSDLVHHFDDVLRVNNVSLFYKPATYRIGEAGKPQTGERPLSLKYDVTFSTNPSILREIAYVVAKSPEIEKAKQTSELQLKNACEKESKIKLSKGKPNWTKPGVGVNSFPPPPSLLRVPISQLHTPQASVVTDPQSGLLSRSSTATSTTSDPGATTPILESPVPARKGGRRLKSKSKQTKKAKKTKKTNKRKSRRC